MLKLKEWNEAICYAKARCERESENSGLLICYAPYTMYDGRKGIRFFVKDDAGSVFATQCSGIHDSLSALKNAIDASIGRLIREC